MKKSKFVPTPDVLETRVVLSGGPQFARNGAAVLTKHALSQTYSQVSSAFTKFAHHGQNYNALQVNLAKAVSRIPYNHRDGLLATIESEVSGLRANISSGVSRPVATAMQNAMADVHDFVQGEVEADAIVVR
jgi:hypothetical protein